jgi:murein endopeptidase
MDMSRRGGGRFRPHESHQSGRDVDIRLPLRQGLAKGTIPVSSSQVDWDAAWALVRALISTEQVRFIFLARNRQPALHKAAKRAGAGDDELGLWLQYPRRSRTALVRHARGHVKHIHVRFRCGPNEPSCIEP